MIKIYEYFYHQIVQCPHCKKLLDSDLAKHFTNEDGDEAEHECEYCFENFYAIKEPLLEEVYICRIPWMLARKLMYSLRLPL
jgi:hypothetical protein